MSGMQHSEHLVEFFDADADLVRVVTHYLAQGFDAGHTCICVVTAEHREMIENRLVAIGANPGALAASYRYIPIDARATLDTLTQGGDRPDRERFHRIVGLLVSQAASRGAPVRIFGEMVALLARRGLYQAVLELEELWNELSRERDFMLLCGYPREAFTTEQLDTISAVHSRPLGSRGATLPNAPAS